MIEKENKFAFTVKMGAKGQIVIPSKARKIFGYKPGDTILLLGDVDKGLALVKASQFDEIYNLIINNK